MTLLGQILCVFKGHDVSEDDEIKVCKTGYLDTMCKRCKYPLILTCRDDLDYFYYQEK